MRQMQIYRLLSPLEIMREKTYTKSVLILLTQMKYEV